MAGRRNGYASASGQSNPASAPTTARDEPHGCRRFLSATASNGGRLRLTLTGTSTVSGCRASTNTYDGGIASVRVVLAGATADRPVIGPLAAAIPRMCVVVFRFRTKFPTRPRRFLRFFCFFGPGAKPCPKIWRIMEKSQRYRCAEQKEKVYQAKCEERSKVAYLSPERKDDVRDNGPLHSEGIIQRIIRFRPGRPRTASADARWGSSPVIVKRNGRSCGSGELAGFVCR